MSNKTKSVIFRFFRAFLAGAVSVMVLATLTNISTWTELGSALNTLGLAGLIGGITGLLQAADKALRTSETGIA